LFENNIISFIGCVGTLGKRPNGNIWVSPTSSLRL
jgi:hypothetical protein